MIRHANLLYVRERRTWLVKNFINAVLLHLRCWTRVSIIFFVKYENVFSAKSSGFASLTAHQLTSTLRNPDITIAGLPLVRVHSLRGFSDISYSTPVTRIFGKTATSSVLPLDLKHKPAIALYSFKTNLFLEGKLENRKHFLICL